MRSIGGYGSGCTTCGDVGCGPCCWSKEHWLRTEFASGSGGVESIPLEAMFFGVLEKHFLDSVSTRIPKKFFGDVRAGCGLKVSHSHTLEGTNLRRILRRFCDECVRSNDSSSIRRHLNSSVYTLEFDVIAVRPHNKVLSKRC